MITTVPLRTTTSAPLLAAGRRRCHQMPLVQDEECGHRELPSCAPGPPPRPASCRSTLVFSFVLVSGDQGALLSLGYPLHLCSPFHSSISSRSPPSQSFMCVLPEFLLLTIQTRASHFPHDYLLTSSLLYPHLPRRFC